MVIFHIKLNGITNAATCKHIFCPNTHPRPLGVGLKVKTFLSESSHVAYQIRREWSVEQRHMLSLHTLSTPGVGSKLFFSESSHVAYQIKGNGA